jgi:hypothetical protein
MAMTDRFEYMHFEPTTGIMYPAEFRFSENEFEHRIDGELRAVGTMTAEYVAVIWQLSGAYDRYMQRLKPTTE